MTQADNAPQVQTFYKNATLSRTLLALWQRHHPTAASLVAEIAQRSFMQFRIDEIVYPVGILLRDAAVQRAQRNPDQKVVLALRHTEPFTGLFGNRRIVGCLEQLHVLHPPASLTEHVPDAVTQQFHVGIADADRKIAVGCRLIADRLIGG